MLEEKEGDEEKKLFSCDTSLYKYLKRNSYMDYWGSGSVALNNIFDENF